MLITALNIQGYTFTGQVRRCDLPAFYQRGLPDIYSFSIKGYFHMGPSGLYLDYMELFIPKCAPKLLSEQYVPYTNIEKELTKLFFRGAM